MDRAHGPGHTGGPRAGEQRQLGGRIRVHARGHVPEQRGIPSEVMFSTARLAWSGQLAQDLMLEHGADHGHRQLTLGAKAPPRIGSS